MPTTHQDKEYDLIQLVRQMLVMVDPGRDQDDEDTLVMMNRAIRFGILEVAGVIANLKPSKLRARLARGTLRKLGQNEIPVGFGSGHEGIEDNALPYEFRVEYLAPEHEVVSGEKLIRETLEYAPHKGLVLTLLSQLTDAAAALRAYPDLFREKVRRITIMGGVVADDTGPKLDDNGFFLPDLSAQNHAFDKEAAEYLYREAQARAIPLTIVSRHAAAQAKIPRAMYDQMAATGHPVGVRLRNAQKAAIQELWQRANLPAGHSGRHGLPARCNQNWFLSTFCLPGTTAELQHDIWQAIKSFILYDPCTLVAAIPGLREYFYRPYVHEVLGVEHYLIGLTAKRHGVSHPAELTEYLHRTLIESLILSRTKELAS